jgi:signal peptide peptidase SppA
MKNYKLLSAILKGPWLINPEVAETYLPIVASLLSGKIPEGYGHSHEQHPENPTPLQVFTIGSGESGIIAASKMKSYADAPQGSIAVISLSGPLMKEDNCGDPGTETIGNRIKEADQSPNIDGIILKIDSPGGSVDGTAALADIVGNTNKPILSFVDGMMCSAAMWIGSAGDEIMASGETDIIGSIGTMISFADMQPIYEKMGMKFHNIYADGSEDKNKTFAEAKAGNYTPIKNEMLNPMNAVFTKTIQKNRAGKIDMEKENVLTGKTYLSKKAKSAGLIDSIGSMDAAVKKVSKMAKDRSAGATHEEAINQNEDIMKVKFLAACTAVAAFFGFKAIEGQSHIEGEITPENWNELNARLESVNALEARVAELETAVTASEDALAVANASLTEMTAKKEAWKAKAKEYGAESGGDKKIAVKTETDKLPEGEAKDAIVDAQSEHMLAAKKILG